MLHRMQYKNIPIPVKKQTSIENFKYVVKDKVGIDAMCFSIRCCKIQALSITPTVSTILLCVFVHVHISCVHIPFSLHWLACLLSLVPV